MLTINDCLGQRILCYVDYSEDLKSRVYPQYVIDKSTKLIYIPEELRKTITRGKGYLAASQYALDQEYPILEIQNFHLTNSLKRRYGGKFLPYAFEECYLCFNKSDLKSKELLESGSFRVNANLLPLVKCDIFIRCKDVIVGPFAYEQYGRNVHIKGDSVYDNVISWYGVNSFRRYPLSMGRFGSVELLQRHDVYSAVPMMKKEYVKSSHSTVQSEQAAEQVGNEYSLYREENESLKRILKKFNLVDDETEKVNFKDFEDRLYIVDSKLMSLARIRKGVNKEEAENLHQTVKTLEEENKKLKEQLDGFILERSASEDEAKRQKQEISEIGDKVNQALDDKIIELQGKIDEYKTIASGFAAQVDEKLRGKIQTLITSLNVGNLDSTTAKDAASRIPPLPMLRFGAEIETVDLGKQIIKRVQGYLVAKKRLCTAEELANYLVCVTQGFMTTFAGNPGSGKTSLCNLLAKALGLVAEHDGTHFVDVPVSRGWTSAKDFIGYYNPLAKQMVRSNAAVYKALELSEQEDSGEVPPMVILLDEANLSPLEHYWSSFLKNSDFSSSSARSFSLGGDKVWKINPHLRFLATVNHDHTTEELSPRFLDRSWVILLDGQSSEVDARDINIPDISGEWAAIPYAKLEEAFGVTAHAKLTMKPEVHQLWIDICDVMQKSQMRIMPRNVNMVENYVKTASLYMSDTFAPLDYAMAQKILPTLSGSGERMKDCLTQLHRLCDGKLPRTASLLARMLEAGKHNMEMYQFFVS